VLARGKGGARARVSTERDVCVCVGGLALGRGGDSCAHTCRMIQRVGLGLRGWGL